MSTQSTQPDAQTIALSLPDNTVIRGLQWNSGAPIKLLASHGWLDNAHSFVPIAQYLPDNIELIAIDHAGHGLSDHRPPGQWYHFIDYTRDLLAVLDQLETADPGWQQAHLLGHSLGGATTCCSAAAMPERILSLSVIEGLGPLGGDPSEAGTRLQQAAQGLRKAAQLVNQRDSQRVSQQGSQRLRQYGDQKAAVAARLESNQMHPDSAALLINRGLKKSENGWVWRTDPRLRSASAMRFTESEVLHLLAAIRCPVLQIMPDPVSAFIQHTGMQRRRAMLKDYRQVDIKGHHHLHMDTPEPCAKAIFEFILQTSNCHTGTLENE